MGKLNGEAMYTIYLPGDDIPPPSKFVFHHPPPDVLTEAQEKQLEEVGARLKAEYGPNALRISINPPEIEAEHI